MNYKSIKYQVTNGVARIIFNRPDQLNAMNRAMMEEIIDALKTVDDSDEKLVRVCVLTGEGKAFMAGADIKEYATQTLEQFEAFQLRGRSLYHAIEFNSKPVVAAVNGYAFGGGFEIALSCDLILARQHSKMGLPEINLKLIPGGGGTQRLAKKTGTNYANELIMTGRSATAEELLGRGLVNHVFAKETFDEEVEQFAAELAKRPADRLAAIKGLTKHSQGEVDPTALDREMEALSRFYQSAEGQASIQSFYQQSLEKKK